MSAGMYHVLGVEFTAALVGEEAHQLIETHFEKGGAIFRTIAPPGFTMNS